MNNQELTKRVHTAMANQCKVRGYTTPVDVLMEIGVLSKANYKNGRHGRGYTGSGLYLYFSKLSLIMHEIRSYAKKNKLKPSFTVYKQWKTKQKIILRFSKHGNPSIEKGYATHYIDSVQIQALKNNEDSDKNKRD